MGTLDEDKLVMKFCGLEWPREYVHDYFVFLCEHEKRRKENYMYSPQRKYRNDLVTWMKEICQICNLSFLTLHLAAYILDSFMDQHEIKPFRLRFIASTALSIAAKFEENGSIVPSFRKMYSINNPHMAPPSNNVICQMEWKVFRYMNCNLHVPTVAHFIYYFLVTGLLETDFSQRPDVSEKVIRLALRDQLQFSLDSMLYDLWSLKLPPSWMASASLIYARRHLGLSPDWPPEFEELTKLSLKALKPALRILETYYFPKENQTSLVESPNDSGYASDLSTPNAEHPQQRTSQNSQITRVNQYCCPMSQEQSPTSLPNSSENCNSCAGQGNNTELLENDQDMVICSQDSVEME